MFFSDPWCGAGGVPPTINIPADPTKTWADVAQEFVDAGFALADFVDLVLTHAGAIALGIPGRAGDSLQDLADDGIPIGIGAEFMWDCPP